MTPALRQARLRPEFAHLYPGVSAGIWEVAANVAERLQTRVEWTHDRPREQGRLMDESHFEFRGGARLSRPGSGRRSRWNDPPTTH